MDLVTNIHKHATEIVLFLISCCKNKNNRNSHDGFVDSNNKTVCLERYDYSFNDNINLSGKEENNKETKERIKKNVHAVRKLLYRR